MSNLPYTKITTDDNRTYIDMPDNDYNPCLNCGACCSNFRVSFYHGELEGSINGFVPLHYTEKLNPHFAVMIGTNSKKPHCVALEGNVGEKISCKIYANRPTPCREWQVWDENGIPNPKCQELRTKYNIPLIKNLAI